MEKIKLHDGTYAEVRQYTVINLSGDVYQVVSGLTDVVFQGSISDCEAWIRLKEAGYLR